MKEKVIEFKKQIHPILSDIRRWKQVKDNAFEIRIGWDQIEYVRDELRKNLLERFVLEMNNEGGNVLTCESKDGMMYFMIQ